MLMLTRRRGESVDVLDKKGNVVLTVLIAEFLPGNVVRLGFAADPSKYDIFRDNAKHREQRTDAPTDALVPNHAGPTITYKGKREI